MNTPAPIFAAGMNIDREQFRDAALQMIREDFALLAPEPMRDAIGLQAAIAFEIEEGLQIRPARRIALAHHAHVARGLMRHLRIGGIGFADHFAQLQRRQIAVPELLRQVIRERVLDAVVVQDRGVQVGREQRLLRRRLHRLDAQLRPDAA